MAHREDTSALLPDFCAIATLFPVVVIGELLAFVLVLKPGAPQTAIWQDLAMTSLFVQWVVLSSSGVLCVARRRINRMRAGSAAVLALVLIVAVVAVLSEAAFWLIAAGHVPLTLQPSSEIGDSVMWLAQQDVVVLSLPAALHADFLLRNVGIGTIVGAVALRYTYVQYQWKRRVESEARARVAALQARIRPHFLFNSMNTIASFTRSRPELAEQVVEDLADLFRAGLLGDDDRSTLGQELDLIRQYLNIESLRLGERLRIEWDTAEVPLDAVLPALCLQPLVENAVYHGVEPLPDGGVVCIRGGLDGRTISVGITNSAPAGGSTRQGNQVAQANVAERLDVYFDGAARFETCLRDGEYAVDLAFPYRTADP